MLWALFKLLKFPHDYWSNWSSTTINYYDNISYSFFSVPSILGVVLYWLKYDFRRKFVNKSCFILPYLQNKLAYVNIGPVIQKVYFFIIAVFLYKCAYFNGGVDLIQLQSELFISYFLVIWGAWAPFKSLKSSKDYYTSITRAISYLRISYNFNLEPSTSGVVFYPKRVKYWF